MRRILAATLLAATVLTPTASFAAEGCVTEYFLTGDDTEGDPIVERHPDGSITIHPPSVRIPAPVPTAVAVVNHVSGFVGCVV